MPSLEETKRSVKETLAKQANEDANHDDILAALQDEIDKHNAVKDGLRSTMRRSKRCDDSGEEKSENTSMKFRFKAGVQDPRDRRRRTRSRRSEVHHGDDDKDSRRKRSKRSHYPTPPKEEGETSAAHPFPREPTSIRETPDTNSDTAFRASLFDALADDEGAAAYWEHVYGEPIHTYPRPSVHNPTDGSLEQMKDDEYVEYVKTKMWERKHPEIVIERKRSEKERKMKEEERTRRREEFIRRRERAAWERAQGWRGARVDGESGYEFAGEANRAPSERDRQEKEYKEAWSTYLAAWDALKYDLLTEQQSGKVSEVTPSKRIPWPVLPEKPVIRANIEAFMRSGPSDSARSKAQSLKAERVRWHPDKVQQRFRGEVDEGTMKLVTGVFQVVDDIFDEALRSAT